MQVRNAFLLFDAPLALVYSCYSFSNSATQAATKFFKAPAPMDALFDLLGRIEASIHEQPELLKERALLEAEMMYTHYAMKISLGKLNNKLDGDAKEGVMRSKQFIEKISQINF
ncbi:hypothetical protein PAPHI01_0942 [Pancytospora philotis]|nr:hypothetical protein PAPHI01_0942 [Pancytospora philotis]